MQLVRVAALGAGIGGAPRLREVRDDASFGAATGDILGTGSFDVPAHPHAAGAEQAPVVVHPKKRV